MTMYRMTEYSPVAGLYGPDDEVPVRAGNVTLHESMDAALAALAAGVYRVETPEIEHVPADLGPEMWIVRQGGVIRADLVAIGA